METPRGHVMNPWGNLPNNVTAMLSVLVYENMPYTHSYWQVKYFITKLVKE